MLHLERVFPSEDLQPSTSSDACPSTSSNCTRNRKGKAKKLSVCVPVPGKDSRKMAERTSDIEANSDEEVHLSLIHI